MAAPSRNNELLVNKTGDQTVINPGIIVNLFKNVRDTNGKIVTAKTQGIFTLLRTIHELTLSSDRSTYQDVFRFANTDGV